MRGPAPLLLACGFLLGLATCQTQGESREASWNTVQQSRSSRDDAEFLEPASNLYQQQQKQQQQQQEQRSESVEYYDDEEYYDDDVPIAGLTQEGVREPKVAKSDDELPGSINGTADEDSYYYVDDYEEEDEAARPGMAGTSAAAAPVGIVNGSELVQHPEKLESAEKSTKATPKREKDKELTKDKWEEEEEQSEDENEEKEPEATISRISSDRKETRSEAGGARLPENVDDPVDNDGPILIGEAIVSVVTTKSVVNGTYSLPETTLSPTPTTIFSTERTEPISSSTGTTTPTSTTTTATTATTITTTTTDTINSNSSSSSSNPTAVTITDGKVSSSSEFPPSSTIQPAVQTGRSVSGARFLPFPSVDKVEQLDSTESIIDKLDRVQSELSSGFLANGRYVEFNALFTPDVPWFVPRRYNKKPFSATSLTLPTTSTIAPTSSPIAPITITSITKRPRVLTTLDDVGAFLPKDFSRSYYRTSTTASPLTKRPKIQTTLDDMEAFLPKDFPKNSYRTSTPSSSTTKRPKLQTTLDDLDGFLPKDYPKSNYRNSFKRPLHKTSTTLSSTSSTTEKSSANTNSKALTTIEDISAFLPPGYKLKKEDITTEKSSILSELLAKNKLSESKDVSPISSTINERTKSIQDLFVKSEIDISALLPPGYKPENTDASNSSKAINISGGIQDLISKSNVDISALLPPGIGNTDGTLARQPTPLGAKGVTAGGNSFKVVFPSRPGGRKSINKITTPPSVANNRGSGGGGGGSDAATPRIQKGWPTRVTTEFTGWPSPPTTSISIEKLLEAARTATAASINVSLLPTISETTSTSTTTTTTTTTLRPTTPGICEEDCEVAGTIKIIENATWLPELFDRNTREWQDLAEEIEREMNLVFAKSPVLRKWFRKIRIDSFSQGSVLVDYFVELADLKEKINTQQLKVIFHDSLRTFSFDNPMEARPKGPMKLGKFTIDPKSTDFVVIPKVAAPNMIQDENRLIPQWAIAVIVIGVGGLLFIIVFGVSVLVNRQHGSKLKPSITAMYEEEVSKNVISHATTSSRPVSEYQKNESQTMWNDAGWQDKPFESTSHKILVDGLPYERKYNMYDSWKSEWNGYYYPPTHHSGSKSSRHHPDYDINF
ncbi:PREDICTED: flocculation protein FLO11 [Ceratosolen solmsi marchali]|uniref:Flocculation protein FLO11 n=1 Tax=Ceratosolen solmsi marchali TaxID=326594 RepID=A0AAJ6VIX5_9HYME|nr:PREDICTED: flocculation protein FLO11 [Ceratosolen solmsi marchali]